MRQTGSEILDEPDADRAKRTRLDRLLDKNARRSPRWAIPLSLALIAAAFAVSVASFGSVTGSRPAPDQGDLKPLVDVHEFMEHIMEGAFAAVMQGLKDKPADANAWRAVRDASLLLGESGNLLLIRKPDGADSGEWSKLCLALRESGDTLTKAAKSKDYNASRGAYLAVVRSCNQCHTQFGDDGEPKIDP
jgi:hypothetical protein